MLQKELEMEKITCDLVSKLTNICTYVYNIILYTIYELNVYLGLLNIREKYQDTPGSSSIYQNAPESSNYPYIKKIRFIK